MIDIDNRLRAAIRFPGSFGALCRELDASDGVGLSRYVEYLLDDSALPTTVRGTIQPAGTFPGTDWQNVVRQCKLLLFRHGLSHGASPSTRLSVEAYRELSFDRLAELRREPYSACRLQIKDDIVRELVRAYLEGQMAGAETHTDLAAQTKAREDYAAGNCINARIKKAAFPSSSSSPTITFFMLVTDRDVLIADYAIASFGLVQNLDFRLVVYCNWISPENRAKYFDKWRSRYPFVDILIPEWMTEATRPTTHQGYGYGVEGPYERCEVPWDRELPLLTSQYHATVDADFEILSPAFVTTIAKAMDGSESLGFVGTDGTHDVVLNDPFYQGKNILMSRVDTWYCVYRRETSACGVSHMHYHEPADERDFALRVWDSSALRQMVLRTVHGYGGSPLPVGFFQQYIHYAAFSKNRHLDDTNIGMYRQLMILEKIGHSNLMDPANYLECVAQLKGLLNQVGLPFPDEATVSELARTLYGKLFQHVDQSNPYKG